MEQALILLISCLCVFASELLARHTVLRLAGAALLVIVLGTVVANLGLIPAGSSPEEPVPVYQLIFAYAAPLSIFWLLLQVELRRVLEAGLGMIVLFCVGSVGTVLGALLGMRLIGGAPALGDHAGHVAGMYVGTYTGGSINFNAIALHYGVVEQGVVFAGAVVVDNVLTMVWMAGTLVLPRLLRRLVPRRERARSGEGAGVAAQAPSADRDREALDPLRIAAMLGLGLAAVLGSNALARGLELRFGLEIPAMIILTVIALLLAQSRPLLSKVGEGLGLGPGDPFVGAQAMGMFAVYLFLAVVGAHADLGALWAIGALGLDLGVLAGTTIVVHGLVLFGFALALRLDLDATAVASQANIGGGTTALALARGLERDELGAPGILVGALGTALGTFLGFWVAGML
jgi:uncharacterized membrane protein